MAEKICFFIKRIFSELKMIRKRIRFCRICRAVGIVPYKWQADFALGISDYPNYPKGRATGKTMAVMLRLLMQEQSDIIRVGYILRCDPDFRSYELRRIRFYKSEYTRLLYKCRNAGIPVLDIDWREVRTC